MLGNRAVVDNASQRARTADWRWYCATGLVAGLALARLGAEAWPQPWRLAHLLALTAAGALTGIVGGGLVWHLMGDRVATMRAWPLAALCGYVLWPVPTLGLGVGLWVAVTVTLLVLNARQPGRWAVLLVLAGALLLYGCTCSRAVLGADAGEFQLVANVLGIAHPPGYALYTLLGRLFAMLPWETPAARINLFSAVTSALALCLGADLVRRETDSLASGVLFAIALGLSATFWVQSTTANIRSLMVLLLVLAIDALFRWRHSPTPKRLAWAGFAFGLAAGHHSSLLLLAPAVLGFVFACDPEILHQPRRWLAPLGASVASLLVWLYLPIRSATGSPFDPEPITSFAAFWQHVLALGFRGDMFNFRTLPELLARVGVFAQILRLELGWPLVLGGVIGGALLARRDWRAFVLVGGIWFLNALSALTYRAPQTVEYLLPAYASMLLLLASGLGGWRPTAWRVDLRAALLAGLLVAALANGARNLPSLRMLREDASDERYAGALLANAPHGALILSNWHHATPMWYLQTIAGQRPDVDVVYVHPEGATPNEEVWLRRIEEGLATRPVLVTNWFYAYEHTGFRFLPLAGGWQAVAEGQGVMAADAQPIDALFDEGMHLMGASVEASEAYPGGEVRVRVYWQATQPLDRDYVGFVQLVGAEGALGQGDVRHRMDVTSPDELRVDSHTLSLLWHAKPGAYQLIAGFYYLDDDGGWQRCMVDGADHLVIGEVEVTPRQYAVASVHPLRVSYPGGLLLTGYDYDRGVEGETRVYLHVRRAMVASIQEASPPVSLHLYADGEPTAAAELPPLAPGEAATIALDLPGTPKALDLIAGSTEGEQLPRAGAWHLRQQRPLRLRLPKEAQRYVPLGGGVAYTGLQAHTGRWPIEGFRLQSHWLALEPLARDYTVSVGVRAEQGEVKADGTPAMGAIPTLKWLSGWQVWDARALAPNGFDLATAHSYTIEMYDAFTLAPLQVLDERLVREGQGTRLLESVAGP